MADRLSFVLGRRTPALMDTLNRVAERGGFYASEGLAIDNVGVGGAAEAAEVCSSGRGDICPIGIEPIFTGYADGIRLKLFFARLARYTYVLGVPADGPVRTLADFRGRTIGVHILGAGSAGKVAVDSMLAAAGLDESDYTLRAIGYEHDAMDAVTSGAVAGAAFPAYELIPFELAGHALRIFRHPVLGDIVNGGYAAAPSTIEEKGHLLARFTRAIVRASLFVHAEPAAAARYVLEASNAPFTEDDLAVKARALRLWDALPGRDRTSMQIGYIPPAGIEAYSRILVEHGLLQHAFRADDVITNRFVTFANDVPR